MKYDKRIEFIREYPSGSRRKYDLQVSVDTDRAEVLRKQLSQKKKETLQEIYRKFGCNVDVWASKSLASAFDHNSIEYGTTPKGAPSFTKEFLAGHPHELPQMILR